MMNHLVLRQAGPKIGVQISTSPIEIVGEWRQNLLPPEVVNNGRCLLGKIVTSPLSIHVKVIDGLPRYATGDVKP
jgi:hypothetical protein